MTPLRQRMIDDMQLRGLSAQTQAAYVQAVRQLAQYFNTPPDRLTDDQLRRYFLYLRTEKQVSASTITVTLCAIRFLYQHTLKRSWPLLDYIRPPKAQPLPVVLSRDEVCAILQQVQTPRHRVCLSIIYACGLRLMEGVRLQVTNIDSARMMLHIQNGKGNKDRCIPLPLPALTMLRAHWRSHRHPRWLFPSHSGASTFFGETPANDDTVFGPSYWHEMALCALIPTIFSRGLRSFVRESSAENPHLAFKARPM